MATFQKLQTITVTGATQAALDFTSIPQTYTDLVIYFSARANRNNLMADGVFIRFNTDYTAGNYSQQRLIGSGSAASADFGTAFGGAGLTNADTATSSSIFSNSQIYIPNYTGSIKKAWQTLGVSENNATQSYTQFAAGSWTGTAAITAIRLIPEVATAWYQNTTAYLYGISNA